MPDEESFLLKLLHSFDRLVAPKDRKPSKEELLRLEARRAEVRRKMEEPIKPPTDPEEVDDIGLQVEALRRRNKVFSTASPDAWNK